MDTVEIDRKFPPVVLGFYSEQILTFNPNQALLLIYTPSHYYNRIYAVYYWSTTEHTPQNMYMYHFIHNYMEGKVHLCKCDTIYDSQKSTQTL